jgi:uncharacterized protein YndB with AHSA1/START domain
VQAGKNNFMSTEQLEIKAGLQVLKPVAEVFETIADPDKMKNYFISKGSSYMKEGETVIWKFPEMDIEFPVEIGKIKNPNYISFHWDGAFDGEQTFVEMNLQEIENDITFISITEKSKPNNEAGIKWLKSNTEGWANFLACLKAWMEYGVHLREGAFNKSQLPV